MSEWREPIGSRPRVRDIARAIRDGQPYTDEQLAHAIDYMLRVGGLQEYMDLLGSLHRRVREASVGDQRGGERVETAADLRRALVELHDRALRAEAERDRLREAIARVRSHCLTAQEWFKDEPSRRAEFAYVEALTRKADA